jgi:putative transposase
VNCGTSGEEAGMEKESNSTPALVDLSEAQRRQAMTRFAVLRPHLEGDAPLARTARDAGVPIRTVQRWLTRY